MSIVSEFIGIVNDVKGGLDKLQLGDAKKAATFDDTMSKRYFTRPIESVARKAKKSVIEFPVIVSESISPEVASAIAKTNQTLATEYVRMMIANQEVMDIRGSGEKDLEDVKNTFIAKLRGSSLEEEVLNHEFNETVGKYLKRNLDTITEDINKEDQLTLTKPLFESTLTDFDTVFNEASAKRKEREEDRKNNQTSQDDDDDRDDYVDAGVAMKREFKVLEEKAKKGDVQYIQDFINGDLPYVGVGMPTNHPMFNIIHHGHMVEDHMNKLNEIMHQALAVNENKRTKERESLKDTNKRLQKEIDSLKEAGMDERKAVKELTKIYKDSENSASVSRSAAASSKEITLQPTILDLGVQLVYSDNSDPVKTNITMGVLSRVHGIPAGDIVTNIGDSFKRGSLMFNFLRVTSGEIRFLKDFVLTLDDIKSQYLSKSKGDKLFHKLRRQVEWNKQAQNIVSKAINKREYVPPTSTLVISVDEVDRIKDIYNIDLHNSSNVRKFMNMTNLMGFMIVDESIGSLAVFEDGDSDFNIIAINEIMRAAGKQDSQVKDLLTIMARR